MNKSFSALDVIFLVIVVILLLLSAGFYAARGMEPVEQAATPTPQLAVMAPPWPTSTARPTATPLEESDLTATQEALVGESPAGATPASGEAGVTVTPTFEPPPPGSSVSIREEQRPDGLYLVLSPSQFSPVYAVGPLAKGTYAVGPNDHFLVYVTNAGEVYALRFGDKTFTRVADLKDQLTASSKHVDPKYELSFAESHSAVVLVVAERRFGQTIPVPLPGRITE